MPRRDDHREAKRDLARRALERSTEGVVPDMARLLDAVPGLVNEARRRRLATGRDPISDLVPLAWKALPRLAAVAAALVLVSAGFYVREIGLESGSKVEANEKVSGEVNTLLLTGTWVEGGEDLLLEAILRNENGRENGNG